MAGTGQLALDDRVGGLNGEVLSKPVVGVVVAMSSLLVVLIVVIAVNAPSNEPGAPAIGSSTEVTSPTTTTTTTTTQTFVPVPTTTTTWTPPPPRPPADGANVGACADLSCDVTVTMGTEIPLARPASEHGPAYTQLYRVAAMDHAGRSITLHSLSRLNGQPIFTVDLRPGQYTELPDYTIEFVGFLSSGAAHVKVCGTVPADPRFGGGGCS